MHWPKVNKRRLHYDDYNVQYNHTKQTLTQNSENDLDKSCTEDKKIWRIRMKKNLLTIFFIMLIMATFQGVSIASSNVVYITHGDHKDTISYNSISDSKHRYTSACPASGKWITSSSSHNYSSWKTNNDGTHSRKCSDCLYVQTGKHTYGAWKSISDTQHRKDCTVCNGYLKDSHKVTTAATCTTAAYCGTCSSYYGDALGHIEPDSYSVSTTQHWKLCDRGCGAYVKEKENHKDENTDSICDVCGYIMDNIAPTIAFNPITNTMVAKQHSTIVTVTDEGGSGVGECKYVWTTNSTAPTEEASYTTAFTTGSSLKTPVGTGTYYLHVLAKDGGGNTAKNSSQGFVIDNTAPVGTIKINNGASFTTSNNVTLNISSSSSDVYQMAINDEATKPTYEAYATTRAWQFDATEGEKTIYYWFKDAIGNESGMNKVSILLDLSNPTLGTLNVDSVTTNSISVTVVGAKDSVSGIKSYDYYLDGNLVAEGVKSTTYTYTSLTPNTSYALSYLVRDNVDKTAGPSAAVNKYTLAAMPANITAVTKSSGTAIDISWGANGNSAGTTYILEYTIDGNSWTQLASTTNLTYSHTGLAKNQTIQYRVKARNGESIDTNYNGPSVAKTTQEVILNTIILDTVAPLAIFTLNEDSKGIDLSFTVDIEEANKIDELKYKWTTTATKLTTASEFTDGTFNPGDEIQIPEGYEGGNYYLQVYTKDKATNEGIYVSSVFEYHSHIGAVEVLIEQGRLYTNTSEVTLALNAPGATQMYISENQIKISEIAENAWITYAETMEFTLSSEDGTKIVYAYFRDAYGDYGESPANDDILLDTTAPIIGDVIGPQYTNKESGNTVEISASGFDDFGGSADMDYYSVIWQYKIEDGEFVTGSSKSVATSNDTFLLPITEEGLYIVRITLIDRAGNSQDNYKDIEVIVDRTAPEIGSITESSTSNYADGEKILINAKDINDPISGVSKVSGIDYCNWSYTNSSNTTTETAGAIINNNSEYEFTVSSEGTYVATITVYDKAGNRGTATTNITVDRTGPDISAFDMSLSATTTTITATISGATDDMQVAGYKYYIGVTESELVETSLKDSNIYTFEGLAPAKGYYIAYKVVDIYGNESEISEIKKKYTLANAPIDLNATDGIYAKRIDIEWDNNENSDEAIYELEISEDGTQWTAVIYSGNDLAYNHMGLDTNSTKYYRARAKNAEGIYSEYSNIDIGSTIEDAEIPIFYISSVENMTTGLEGGMRGSDTLKIVIIGYDESYKEHSIIEEDITFIVDYDEVTVTQKEIESIIEKEDGIEITLIISGVANEGELLVCIPEGKITDIVGNVNEAENISTGVIVDNTLPEVTANNIDYGEKEYIGLSDMGSGIKYWAITTGTTAPTEYAEIPNIEDVEEELISGDEYIYEEDLVNQVSGDQLNVWYEVSRTVGSLTTTFEGLNVGIYYAWGRDTAGNVDSKIFVVKQPEEENNNLLNAIVTLNPTIYQYDGTAKEPKVTVEFEGNILEENVDYTVTYKDNIEVGTATAVITGIGDYRGEISENFIINPVATEDDEIVLDTVGPTISNIIGTAGESITITADIEDPDISEGIPGRG